MKLVGADRLSEGLLAKAIWNGVVLAESNETIVVEGNQYFPPESVNSDYLRSSNAMSVCPWKGTASYYDIVVDGETNAGAAWFYPTPNPAASDIKNYIAFWRGIEIKR